MRRTLLTVAFVAAAGTAGAQTVQAPATGTKSTSTSIGSAPTRANAPLPPDRAAEAARKRIETEGYTEVQGLAKGADGLWQGTAVRAGTPVQVTVDRSGNVAAK